MNRGINITDKYKLPFLVDIFRCRCIKKNKKPIIGIYKITSPSGKIYIGLSKDLESRLSQYKTINCKLQQYLYNSLKKHGVENHKFEIIHICKEEELEHLESYYGKKFNVTNKKFGLNIRECGGKRGKLGKRTKKLMSESRKGEKNHFFGKKHPSERIKHFSEIKIGENNPNYGNRMSLKSKIKLSDMRMGEKNPFYDKKHTPETLKILSEKGKNISVEARKKKSESMMGEKNHFYKKNHKKSSIKKMSESAKKRIKNPFEGKSHTESNKKIISEKALERFKNKENHPSYKKSPSKKTRKKISKTLKNRYKNLNHPNKGKIISEKQRIILSDLAKKRVGEKNPFYNKNHTKKTKRIISDCNSVKINQYTLDGKLIKKWKSIRVAANKIGVSPSAISKVCQGKHKKSKGFIFKYA